VRTAGAVSKDSAWFLSRSLGFGCLSIVDAATCQVGASTLVNTGSGLAIDGCTRAFFSAAVGFGQISLACGSIAFFVSSISPRCCAFDPLNNQLDVLTSTFLASLSSATWSGWQKSHGIAIGTNPCGIDVDRSGNIAIAGAGQLQTYNSAGTMTNSTPVNGAAFCRFDAAGNLYAGGTTVLVKFNPAFTQVWSISQAYTAMSVGDRFLYCQRDTPTASTTDIINPAAGAVVYSAANVSSPCAIPSSRALGLLNVHGTSGPLAVRIGGTGLIETSGGDRIAAWSTGGTNGIPALSEPMVGRIGAYKW
jgi:hypothetical protein